MTITPFAFYLILGACLIAAELLIFQISIFWFLFIGLGAMFAALTIILVPGTSWLLATTVFVIASTLVALGLYRPLKRWQNKPGALAGNNAIGQKVRILEAVTDRQPGKVSWSGTDWRAELAANSQPLQLGDIAVIVEVNGICLLVKHV